MNKKPLVWAHRGASGYAPENTLAAFRKTVEMGADGVELDIQMTADGELVVCHDEKIDRTSTGTGLIKDFTLAELKELDFSYKFKDEYPEEKIPTMREVFELLKPTTLTINIELKTGIIFYPNIEERILTLTKEFGMEDRVLYSSFNHYTVKRIKELDPAAKVGFLYADGTIDMPNYGKTHGVDALHPALYNIQFPGFLEDCAKNGLEVNVWTVNTGEFAGMACQAGVNAIITNYPDMVQGVINQMLGA